MMGALKSIAKRTPIHRLYKWWQPRHEFRKWGEEDRRRLEFYRAFVPPRSVVFDVGANMGNRTKVFLRLAATVVAVEPQAACADFLEEMVGKNPQVRIVRKALGASVGATEMLISDMHTLSSLSPTWVDATRNSGRFAEFEWNQRQEVELDTLDNLIALYGQPAYVKIDVEGYEAQVLKGLSQPVDMLSIEFTPELMERTIECIEHVSSIMATEFQISQGESMAFDLPGWVSQEEIKKVLEQVAPSTFGDVYMRRYDTDRV